jgi:nucleoside-diphosphate-sugar epimerase
VHFLRAKGHAVGEIDLVNGPEHDLGLMRPGLSRMFSRVDYVFFLAFDAGGSRYLKSHERTFEFVDNNAKLMGSVFNTLRKHRTEFLFVSSQMSRMTWSPYGCLKAIGEKYTESLGGRIVRLWNVYGPESDPQKFHVLSDFIAAARRGRAIRMLTTGREVRQMLHVDDCCRALYEISLNRGAFPDGPLDVTSFKWVEIREIARIVARHYGVSVIPGKKRDELQNDSRFEPSRAMLEFWQPQIGLEAGIRRVIEAVG